MTINDKKFIPYRYSSGELKLKNDYLMSFVKDNKVKIVFNNELSFFELLLLLTYYRSNDVKIDLTLCYLPYQRMDHPNENNVETVKYVAYHLNNLNLNRLNICQPHCELNYFKNAKEINLVEKLFDKVKNEIEFDLDKDKVIFTDKGSVKKFSHLAKNYAYGEKVRDKQTGLISSYKLCGEIENGQKILIIDDIVSSGDTICGILNLLTDFTSSEIYILSAHLENNKYNKRLEQNSQVVKIFSSNSLRKKSTKKIKLFNVVKILND